MNNKKIGNIFKGDKVVWMVFFFLCLISIVEVFSASSSLTYKNGSYWGPALYHGAILMFGIIVMIVVVNIPCKYFKIVTPFMLLLSLVTLLWVLVAGTSTNDANRWVSFLGFQFQPSEIAKGTLVLAVAQILSAMQTDKGADSHTMKYILITCAPIIGLILVENFSTAALLGMVVLIMMIIGRVPIVQIGKLMGIVMLAVVFFVGIILLLGKSDDGENTETKQRITERVEVRERPSTVEKIFHRFGTWKGRILGFFDSREVPPEEFDLDKNSQIGHSNIAIATSNIIGKGPGNSVERDFLPQAFSDFIYAIIIEEMGIIGGGFVAILYIILLFRTGRIANRCENNFPAFLAMGLALLLVSQALFNMLVAVGLAPVTGQPLPLVSKGGTSSVINCIYIGVILSISRSAKKKDVQAERIKVAT